MPWTPVHVGLLPLPAMINSSNATATSTKQHSCGQWVVMRRDEQVLQATAAEGCPDAMNAAQLSAPGYVLDAAGSWGVFRAQYPAEQRAALRDWLVNYTRHGAGPTAVTHAGSSSNNSRVELDVDLVLMAARVLQDQAALSVSAFGEVPGGEVWEVLQAAVNATVAAHVQLQQETGQASGPANVGFGVVLHSMLLPVVPTVELVLDRLAGSRVCWLQQQVCGWQWY